MAKVSMKTREEVIAAQRAKYRKGKKKEKGEILDMLCETTGLSRSRAKHVLAGDGQAAGKARREASRAACGKRGRKQKYDAQFTASLAKMWAYMGYATGKRLAAGMADLLEALERCGEVDFGADVRAKLLEVSASTADRLLRDRKARLAGKGKATTKPGTLLKKDIPLRLGTEWDDAVAGFVEIDLVAHCGDTAAGEYINTLDVTDISTGWTETEAVINKAQRHVFAALTGIEGRQPFPFRGIDSDNGSEFINAHLLRFCKGRGIKFTRSRPYTKNDNCHVEQKNWHLVRQNIGYGRYEGAEALDVMNRYYGLLRLYFNYFLPQTKLIGRVREGSRIRKTYDTPKTPYRRALDSDSVAPEEKGRLTATFMGLNPAALQREMSGLLDKLERLQVRHLRPEDDATCGEAVAQSGQQCQGQDMRPAGAT